MMGAVGWFARHTVAANLLMVMIMVGGLIAVVGIPLPFLPEAMRRPAVQQEVFPELSLDLITVTVPYLGAAPEEVEEGVCVRVEEAIQGLDGVKRITSLANEGVGVVSVELLLGADSRIVLDDVKARVDAIDTFPDQTEKPIIREITNRRQVIDVAISGRADEWSLRHVAERVRDEISALPGITLVELANARPFEISIEVSESALRRHGLTFDQVANAVRSSSLDLPGGSLRTEGGEILLRTKGQAYSQRDFEGLVLISRPDGTHLRLGEVAQVVDGFAETDQFTRFDGETAMLVQVFRVGKQDALHTADRVKAYLADAQPRMPEGISLNIWQDTSELLRARRNLLMRNAATGFALVILILALFLNLRLAAWVSLGIPISFLGAMWVMPGLDLTINMISMFAFIVVLGIVVDDAIIAGENIHRHQQRHRQGLKGAIDGAQEVAVPVTFAVLMTIAAFMPLVTVAGSMGKIMRVIPLIVIPCLVWSLVESLLILPAHLSHLRPRSSELERGAISSAWRRFQSRFSNGLEWFVARVYAPSLDLALQWRYLTVAVGVATLLLTVGIVRGGFIRFIFFPDVESDFVSAAITMPPGTSVEVTSDAVRHLERTAEQVRREIERTYDEDAYKHFLSAIGEQPFGRAQAQNAGSSQGQQISSHLGELTIELTPSEVRTVSSSTIAEMWRSAAGRIPDALELTFTSSLFAAGEDVNVELAGSDLAELRGAADELKRRLAEYDGVYDITDSFRAGKQEVKLNITPAAEVLGLTLTDLARQVRQAFYGEEAQRIQRGRDEVKVMVRYPEAQRRSLGDMENMRIRTPEGAEVPFAEVAEVQLGRGYASIKRVDRRRAINVTAGVDPARATPGEIVEDLKMRVLPELGSRHVGLTYSFEGAQAEQRDTMGGLVRGFAIAMLAIYALLAIPLRSYVQPLVIMSAIPFGLVGAVWGHVIMRLDLTILSMFGLVALTGVVVNDSLVMVDFINRHRSSKGELAQAVRQAGALRFRPILLTSLTTFFGLSPLMLERSMQARFLIPMAVSLAFGVLFSTFITLMLIPSGYLIMEDLRGLFSGGARELEHPVAGRPDSDADLGAGPLPDPLDRPAPVGTGLQRERLGE
jgi:multidrug efflux pump subunit AcrB